MSITTITLLMERLHIQDNSSCQVPMENRDLDILTLKKLAERKHVKIMKNRDSFPLRVRLLNRRHYLEMVRMLEEERKKKKEKDTVAENATDSEVQDNSGENAEMDIDENTSNQQ